MIARAVLCVVLASCFTQAAPEELVKNGDFEAGLSEWGRAPSPRGVRYACETTTGRGRQSKALVIEKVDAEPGTAMCFQRVEIPNDRPGRIELEARVMTEGLREASAAVMVQVWSREQTMISGAWSDRVEVDSAWREVSAVFELPAEAAFLRVLPYLTGNGKAAFDDISMRATAKPLKSSYPPPTAGESRYEKLARHAASEIPWTFDPALARRLAAAEKKPLLVYVRCIDAERALASAATTLAAAEVPFLDDGFRKDLLMRAGPLSDPEVQALITTRFIPVVATYVLARHGNLRAPAADDPLRPLGLDSNAIVTPAFAVLDAEGVLVHVFHRIGVMNAALVGQVLRECLRMAKAGTPPTADPRALLAAGELERAAALLEGDPDLAKPPGAGGDSEKRVLLAAARRRLGELGKAIAALSGLTTPAAHLERGRAFMCFGRLAEARAELDLATAGLDGDERAAALFGSAWCDWHLGAVDEARKKLDGLAGESTYGRKAAAMLIPSGLRLWLAETTSAIEAPRGLLSQTEGGGRPFEPARTIDLLLAMQRPSGSFGGHDGADGYGPWDPAISALAGDALLAWRPKMSAEQGRAAERALAGIARYLAEWVRRPTNPKLGAFDHPYALMHLLRVGEKKAAQIVVDAIVASQEPDKNWTIYDADRPASFNTALNVMALLKARTAGLKVPGSVVESGAKALEAMRTKDGLFPYSTKKGHEWMTTPWGSIARDTLCEHALYLAGKPRKMAIEAALDRFLEYHHELRAPTTKLYDYFNSRGHGGYYYFFAEKNAKDAAALLAPAKRDEIIAEIRREVLAARELDGSWMDHAMIGRAYGTAMALLILAE
jgi:hypothetical protein